MTESNTKAQSVTYVRFFSYRWLVLLVVLIGVSLAAWIAMRNYRAAHALLEADPPSAILNTPERTGIAGLDSVAFTSRDHLQLSGWYRAPGNGAIIILCHGTNSDRTSMLPELRLLTNAGFGVLAFDWPGLGNSRGTIRWDGQARQALTAAIDWVSGQPGVDAERIGGLGFSIGGYVMAQVAADDARLRAVVLEAPTTDFADYMQLHFSHWKGLSEWPARWAIRDSGLLDPAVQPMLLIARIAPRPLLLLGGTEDDEIAPEWVEKLFEHAGEPKTLWIVPGAHHGDYSEVAATEYSQRIAAFFARNLQ